MTKNIITYVGIVLAIVLGVFGLSSKNTVIKQNVGATTSLDQVDSPYYSIGGVRLYSSRQAMSATSTQVCTFNNPFRATSTVVRFSSVITTGILGTNKFTLSTTSTTNLGSYGSSSPALVLEHSVAASAVDSMVWVPNYGTSTPGVLGIAYAGGDGTGAGILLGPNEALTYRFSTSTANTALTAYLAGSCSATIQQI